MGTVLITLAAIGGGAGVIFIANRLGAAQGRLDLLRSQRRRDRG